MSKPRSAVADYAVYLAVRVVLCVVQMLTLPAARRLAGGLAWLLTTSTAAIASSPTTTSNAPFPANTTTVSATGWCGPSTAISARFCVEIAHLPRKLQSRHVAPLRDDGERPSGRRAVAVRPAAPVRHGPLRQLGAGRLRPRPARLHHPRHRPATGQSLSERLPALPLPPADGPDESCTRTAISSGFRACWRPAA